MCLLMRTWVYAVSTTTILLASITFASGGSHQEVVLEKQLIHQKRLLVARHEVAYVPPMTQPPSGLEYVKPAHVYQYDFILLQPHGAKEIVWSHKFLSFAPDSFLPTDLRVLDADVQDNVLVVVYKDSSKLHGGTTFANVITNIARNDKQELSRKEAQLIYDSDSRHTFISKAKISGSVKDKTLTVQLTNEDVLLRFSWKNHQWQSVSGATPDPALQDQPTTPIP